MDRLKNKENAKLRLAFYDLMIAQAAERAQYHETERVAYENVAAGYRSELKRVYEQIRLDTLEGGTYHFRYYEPILADLDNKCKIFDRKVRVANEMVSLTVQTKQHYEKIKNEFIEIQKLK